MITKVTPMNQLEIYANFVAPVVKAIRQHNNEFFRLDYYEISPKDITIDHDNKLWDFMSENKLIPQDFDGDIPLIWGQWDEVDGSIVLMQVKEGVFPGQTGSDFHMFQHKYYQEGGGYAYCDDETTPYIGDALDWVSSKMGLTYLTSDKGMSNLEMVLG